MKDEGQLLRQWAETWGRAAHELEEIRRRELAALDTQTAIRQIFEDAAFRQLPPAPTVSGLVEQQRYFSRLRQRP